ncbi:hypothetical protein Ancab_013150 [Ancistrocladus abbreviatus]
MKLKWESFKVQGIASFILKKKLKRSKEFLKKWKSEVHGDVEANIEALTRKVVSNDEKEEKGTVSNYKLKERKGK